MSKRFSLGIDLGTSNSALAIAPLSGGGKPEIILITQLVGAQTINDRESMPSALYLPAAGEFDATKMRLPWQQDSLAIEPLQIVGEFARNHGALVPDRLVTSAKSWLCHASVDRKAPVLPWKSDIGAQKVSPFEATRLYLDHLRHAFLQAGQQRGEKWSVADAEIVLTVPASFDEAARQLTAEAATAAGWGEVVLLEEPLAAFYAWMARSGADWRKQVQPGDVILVCDVGGGTADFSLVAIAEEKGELRVERIAVGEHILLGGDNMDLALAYTLQAQIAAEGKSLDAWQFLALTHAARQAKEVLLADAKLDSVPISVPSRGSSLFAKTVATKLARTTLEQVVLDGFLPLTKPLEMPQQRRAAGLQELGLSYAGDAAISKHLARFLTRSLLNVQASDALRKLVASRPEALTGTFLQPTAILFNGGVFKSPLIRARVLELLRGWNAAHAIRELSGDEPDLAVAKGAAAYGVTRTTGLGVRIKAGTARSYYIGIESSTLAVPGFKPPVKALCVVPQGMEEGSEAVLPEAEFGLVTGEPADFRFFSSEVRSGDAVGAVVPDAERELEETSHVEVTLTAIAGTPSGDVVPVRLAANVTELGNLELWMQHTQSPQKWKLEFSVRME